MTDLANLKAYLGEADASQWSDAELSGVISSEAAAQRRRIKPLADPADEPDLYEALMRRCARNLAMRKYPLGVMASGGDEGTRVAGADPEIRRLEAPWRRRVVG